MSSLECLAFRSSSWVISFISYQSCFQSIKDWFSLILQSWLQIVFVKNVLSMTRKKILITLKFNTSSFCKFIVKEPDTWNVVWPSAIPQKLSHHLSHYLGVTHYCMLAAKCKIYNKVLISVDMLEALPAGMGRGTLCCRWGCHRWGKSPCF